MMAVCYCCCWNSLWEMTTVVQGSAGNPVIDSDSDGDLTDEILF